MKFKTIAYLIALTVFLPSCYVVRAYRFRKFELDDLRKFRVDSVQKSNHSFQFYDNRNLDADWKIYLDSNLTESHTYGFLVIRNDSILYEKYFDNLDSTNVFPSFSVAKSFVGTLAQIAYQEGDIKSLDDPVTDYLPWLMKSDKNWQHVTIQNVLDMRSGVKSEETYNSPFSDVIRLGFSRNMRPQLQQLKVKNRTKQLEYKSVNTQLLGAVIEAATKKNLPEYLQEKLWQPLGMESDATWQTDAKGMTRAFCCLNATLKDFAKLGRLYLNNGSWNGQSILSKKWVATIFNPDTMRVYQGYKNHWWSSRTMKRFDDSLQAINFMKGKKKEYYMAKGNRNGNIYYGVYNNLPSIFAQGMLGQYIFINPDKNLIIVRMGHKWKHPQLSPQRFIEDLAKRI